MQSELQIVKIIVSAMKLLFMINWLYISLSLNFKG